MPRMASGESRRRLLVVDDDHEVRDAMAAVLRDDGYEVDTASDGETARTKAGQGRFDLIVLDLMLPDADGLLLCSEFSRAQLPVLACSATRRPRDGTLALRLGADGFVSKPFNVEEFSARVARILASREAHESPPPGEPTHASVGRLRMDRKRPRPTARVGAAELEITPTEFRLLFALAKADGQVVSRGELATAAHGYPDPPRGRSMDVQVARLRNKLRGASADVSIVAVYGEGYRLLSEAADQQRSRAA